MNTQESHHKSHQTHKTPKHQITTKTNSPRSTSQSGTADPDDTHQLTNTTKTTMQIDVGYLCTRDGTQKQFLITEPLGMQFLLTELLRGETRTMYSILVADVIDGPDGIQIGTAKVDSLASLLHAALLRVPHDELLQPSCRPP